MNRLPMARPRPMTGPTPAKFTRLGMAAFVLLANTPSPAAAQQPPRRFFVLSMDEVNSKMAFNAMDALAVIERDGTSWTQFPQVSGNVIRSVSASGVADANSRVITYLIDCR